MENYQLLYYDGFCYEVISWQSDDILHQIYLITYHYITDGYENQQHVNRVHVIIRAQKPLFHQGFSPALPLCLFQLTDTARLSPIL